MFHVKHGAEMPSIRSFDVVVVGAGHAGTEAATAAARMGAEVALLTHSKLTIGAMSCNPAFGGIGKSHLIREVDAMDGLIGHCADEAGIHFRVLNRSKGPAVQSPRVQADRDLYKRAIQRRVAQQPNLMVLEEECISLLIDSNRRITGVATAGGRMLAKAVVLATGTFLNAKIHLGDSDVPGGRRNEPASTELAQQLAELGFKIGRLKTGTPPRLDGRGVDFSVLEQQWGDDAREYLSSATENTTTEQTTCFITRTTRATHEIIRQNLSSTATYNGAITASGPRYCPSIEDKVVRFADKASHQIFLEPEGLGSFLVYPNGISTAMPADIQQRLISSIPGLERAPIAQYGYAIAYDYVDPRELRPDLMTHRVCGLFFCGQINGTTGYEEAAAQGLAAGVNSALHSAGKAYLHFSRTTSYIGVMIDDLITKGVTEPYRMFTSRAECRLSLRIDNADERLTETGIQHGVVGASRRAAYEKIKNEIAEARLALSAVQLDAATLSSFGFDVSGSRERRSVADWIEISNVGLEDIADKIPKLASMSKALIKRLNADAKYRPYVARQERDRIRQQQDESLIIPSEFNFDAIPGLSNELRLKFKDKPPVSIAHAAQYEGATPAAMLILAAHAKRSERRKTLPVVAS